MKTIILLILTFISLHIQAQENLTLNDAIRKMLDNNRDLKAEQLKVKQTEYLADNMFNNRLATVKLSGRYSKLSEVDPFKVQLNPAAPAMILVPSITNQSGVKVTVTQPLFTGFKLESAQESAEHNNAASLHDYQSKVTDNVVKLAQSYFLVISTDKALSVLRKNLTQLNQRVRDAERMKSQGLLTDNDVLKIKVKLNEVELAVIQAEDQVKLSRMNLNMMLGDSVNRMYQLSIPTEESGVFKTAVRPELLGMDERIKAQTKAESIAMSDYFPSVYLQFGYDYSNPNQRFFPPKEEWKSSWDVSLLLSYDLWTWDIRSNNVQSAQAGLAMLQESKNQMTEAMKLELMSAEMTVVRARKSISVVERQIEQTDLNMKNTENMYTAGLATTTDVLDAQIQNMQSELQLIQVQLDYQLNKIKLRRANGSLLDWLNLQ